MGSLTRLLREITPAWMVHAEQQADPGEIIPFRPREQPAGEADDLWREHVEKGLFGAATSDYTGVEPEPPSADIEAGSAGKH